MGGEAIAAGAVGRDGLGLLSVDFGRTRLAEIARTPRDPHIVTAQEDGAARARATRP
jgi:hypothetical protein